MAKGWLFSLNSFFDRWFLRGELQNHVQQLFANCDKATTRTFSAEQLEGLPEPVRKYFQLVLPEGAPIVKSLRLKHSGFFKTDLKKDWLEIEGEEYMTCFEPGFVWKGTTKLFTGRDSYVDGKGNLTVSLFSLYTIVNASGPNYDQGELLRWLGEIVWHPAALLPNEYISWKPIDKTSARLELRYKDVQVYYITKFNAKGEIYEVETKRHMNDKGIETWIGRMSDYRESQNGVKVPYTIEGLWRLQDGDFPYAKFNVTSLEYDVPKLFEE